MRKSTKAKVGRTNLDLPDCIMQLVRDEKDSGPSMTRTISAAILWYFTHLDGSDRELARSECVAWVKGQQHGAMEPMTETEMSALSRKASEEGARALSAIEPPRVRAARSRERSDQKRKSSR